jgi:hypothetical protein
MQPERVALQLEPVCHLRTTSGKNWSELLALTQLGEDGYISLQYVLGMVV